MVFAFLLACLVNVPVEVKKNLSTVGEIIAIL